MLSRAPQIAQHLEQIAVWVPGLQRSRQEKVIKGEKQRLLALQAEEGGGLQDHGDAVQLSCPVVGSSIPLGELGSKSNG